MTMHQNCEPVELLLKELNATRASLNSVLLKLDQVLNQINELDEAFVRIYKIIENNIENGVLQAPYQHIEEIRMKQWN